MFVLTIKSWKNHPQKLLRKTQIHFFSLTALTAQTAQTEEFMFQNVAYRPTVYRTGTYTFFGRPFQTLPMQCTVQLWSHISTTHTRQTSADLYCCVPKFILCKIYCDANFLISANYLKRIESIYQNKVGKKNNAWFIFCFFNWSYRSVSIKFDIKMQIC